MTWVQLQAGHLYSAVLALTADINVPGLFIFLLASVASPAWDGLNVMWLSHSNRHNGLEHALSCVGQAFLMEGLPA